MSDCSSARIRPLWLFIIGQSSELEERLSGAKYLTLKLEQGQDQESRAPLPPAGAGGPGASTLMFAGEEACEEGLGGTLGRILHLVQ